MPAPATRIATLVAAATSLAGCGEEAASVRLVPIDRACGRVAAPRALLVTPLGALTADRQLVQPGAAVTLATLPAATRQLAVEVVGEGGAVGAIGKTAPFELAALADGDVLTVAMGPPEGACPAGALLEPRAQPLVARAGDDVLIVGGRGSGPLATAELYDPDREISRAVPVPPTLVRADVGLAGAALAPLPDGRVALVGGPQPGLAVFDPAAGAFGQPVLTGQPRAHHAAVAVDERRVLVVGGCSALAAGGACAAGSAEVASLIIDVVDGQVTPGPALLTPRLDPTIAVEHGRDGVRRFLVIGGVDEAGVAIASGQRIDPESGAVDVVDGLGAAATPLDSGAILTAFAPDGASPAGAGAVVVPGLTAARAIAATPARAGARLVTLEDGQVLAVGGGPPVRYQPAAGSWRGVAAGDGLDVDGGAGVVRLADGTVLVVGGARAGVAIAAVTRFRPRLLGPYGAAASVVPGDLASDPPLTPLDPARVTIAPAWQVGEGAWAIVGGMIGDDLRLEWTGGLPADGAALLVGFVDAGRHHRVDLVPGRPVAIVAVDAGEASVRCEGEATPAAGPIAARAELAGGVLQVRVGGRPLVRCPLSGQLVGRVGVGALGAGAVTIESLAVTR
jgi:hypothetical protein